MYLRRLVGRHVCMCVSFYVCMYVCNVMSCYVISCHVMSCKVR